MNDTKFTAMMVKLHTVTWRIDNAENSTKKYTTIINEQTITLYSSLYNSLLYINGIQPELTGAQEIKVMELLAIIENSFLSEIQDAYDAEQQDLDNAIDEIIA